MLTLYQFPISHFCEKARWALDYKELEHKKVTLLPGLHVRKTKKVAGKSNVPLLNHGDNNIQGSTNIIDYLDLKFDWNMLTPGDPEQKKQALEWETFADKNLGPQVRLVIYHIILDYPDLVIPFMTQGGPWYGPFVVKKMFPKLQEKMRKLMKIDDETAAKSNQQVIKVVDDLASHYANNNYMVGDQFSRADLTAAALLAPIVMPKKYGIDWPTELPEQLIEFNSQFQGKLDWIERLYDEHR